MSRQHDWCDEHSHGARAKQPPSAPPAPFFALSDLWDALEECSAYSAAVPLHLPPTGAPATQHYAPSISGLQLFSRLPAGPPAGLPAPRGAPAPAAPPARACTRAARWSNPA
ncbi:unnamed protein product [Closterium sp. Yama58-4]|nr:unnamed protein product [Closterium sp. Yama58-4]